MIKKVVLCLFIVCGVAIVGMNLWQIYREIGWRFKDGGYSDFFAMKSRCDRDSTVRFLEKHLEPGKSCYFWNNPKENDRVSTECLITDINYYLYPLRVKYGPENLRAGTDYIVTQKQNYHDLNLYMVFYDLDEKYAKIAENRKMVVMRVN